jgi:hypothetical protein
MDSLSFDILNIIYDYCPDDSFKILDVNDILLAMPEGAILSPERLFKIIDELAIDESITLKYRDEDEICVALPAKGKRMVKREREMRAKLEAERKAREEEEARKKAAEEAARIKREEEEARLRAIAEAEEKARLEKEEKERQERLEREEKERQERLEKEKKLEEARLALEELKKERKSKKEVIELKQQVEELEKEIAIPEPEPEPESEPEPEPVPEQAIVEAAAMPVISSVQHMDFIPLIKNVGRKAFWGAMLGAALLNGLYYAVRFALDYLGII